MATRAHLLEPGGPTTASSASPSQNRHVSFVRVVLVRLRKSRRGHKKGGLLWVDWGTAWGCGTTLSASFPTSTPSKKWPGAPGPPRFRRCRSPWPSWPMFTPGPARFLIWRRCLYLACRSVVRLHSNGLPVSPGDCRATGAVRNRPGCRRVPGGTRRASGARIAGAVLQCRTIHSGSLLLIYGGRFARETRSASAVSCSNAWPRRLLSMETTVSLPLSSAGAACPGWDASRRRRSSWPVTRIRSIPSRTRRYLASPYPMPGWSVRRLEEATCSSWTAPADIAPSIKAFIGPTGPSARSPSYLLHQCGQTPCAAAEASDRAGREWRWRDRDWRHRTRG